MTKAARLCRAGALSQMLLLKAHLQPEGHPCMQAEGGEPDKWRKVETTEEAKEGAAQLHLSWMGKAPSGKERCCLSMTSDEVGLCGVNIDPDCPLAEESCEELVPECAQQRLMPEEKEALF